MTRGLCTRGALLALSFVSVTCRDHSPDRDAPRASASPPASTTASAVTLPVPSGSLPEDPVAGAKSAAEWREHLAHEERERRLGYDRRKLPEHRQVLRTLRDARTQYDRATTKPAVLTLEQGFRATRPKLDKAFDDIDHWGVSSKVLPDYKKLADTFADPYPSARIAALGGDKTALERIAREVDATFASIDAWLEEAKESEDE